jgi:hypothetical protein
MVNREFLYSLADADDEGRSIPRDAIVGVRACAARADPPNR